jgi:hypothetical protein
MKHLRRPTVVAAATLSAAVTAGAIGLAATAGERTAPDAIDLTASERLDEVDLPDDVTASVDVTAERAAVVEAPVLPAATDDVSAASAESLDSPLSAQSADSPDSPDSPASPDSPDSPASVASPDSVDSD